MFVVWSGRGHAAGSIAAIVLARPSLPDGRVGPLPRISSAARTGAAAAPPTLAPRTNRLRGPGRTAGSDGGSRALWPRRRAGLGPVTGPTASLPLHRLFVRPLGVSTAAHETMERAAAAQGGKPTRVLFVCLGRAARSPRAHPALTPRSRPRSPWLTREADGSVPCPGPLAGNICRSPMGEAVFKHTVHQRGLEAHFHVDRFVTS